MAPVPAGHRLADGGVHPLCRHAARHRRNRPPPGPLPRPRLELGNRSVDILTRVQSSRAKDYVREFNAALTLWRREPAVRKFIHRTRKELGVAA